MIATPITDEFLRDFEHVLHNMKPEVLLNASNGLTGSWREGRFFIDQEDFKTKKERLEEFIEHNKKLSDTFIEMVFKVIKEAESLIPPDNIERWMHIFRVKCEGAALLLGEIESQKDHDPEKDAYWRVFEKMEADGEIEKAFDFVSPVRKIVAQCSLGWYQLRRFFDNLKKMAELPDSTKKVVPLIADSNTETNLGVAENEIYKFFKEEGKLLIPHIQATFANGTPTNSGLAAFIVAADKLGLFAINVISGGKQIKFIEALWDLFGNKSVKLAAYNSAIKVYDRTGDEDKKEEIKRATIKIKEIIKVGNEIKKP